MRLFEAVLAANQRALAGDPAAGVRIADYIDELPIVALTCIDPRLNRLLPGVLGLPEENFIWLRNAGNIITGPLTSTMRSLALGCAIKGGREIAVIGHTDCHVRQTTAGALLEKFKALGVDRQKLPDNIAEYFGLFAGERQNVIRGVDIIRSSPLIGAKTIVQGLLVDIQTGRLEWVVNGYEMPAQAAVSPAGSQFPPIDWVTGSAAGNTAFEMGEMTSSELQIGEMARKSAEPAPAARAPSVLSVPAPPAPPPPILATPQRPRTIPLPPPIRMKPGKRS
jgi:carbonic anhydrase